MKVTGTKKLLIILFALTCVVTLGLGALFGGWFFKSAPSAYAEEEKAVLPDFADERLQKISEKTGIGVEELVFYIKAGGGTEANLCDFYDAVGEEEFVNAVTGFLADYASGDLQSQINYADEDWFISPDQVGSYVPLPGNQDTVTNYTSSKNALTHEPQYFRNVGFTMGPYDKFVNSQENSVNARNDRAWYESMKYSFAWVEEGEEYYFGVNCNKSITKGRGVVDTETWMNSTATITTSWANWCSTPAAIAAGYTFNNSYVTPTYINGWWFDDVTGSCGNDPDPTRNNRTQWLDEFGSSIDPSTAFMSGAALQRMDGTTAGSTGQMGIWITADAPSGTYYFTLARPRGGYWYGWNNSSYASGDVQNRNIYVPNGSGWKNWFTYVTVAVSICRTGITTPRLKFNNGVDSQLKNKEVDYDGTVQQLIIENDWGPGLITYNISKWDESAGVWVDYANNTPIPGQLDCTLRSTAGQGRKGDTIFEATNAGKYKIKMTPFRNWETENDKDPVEFTFTINPKKLEVPTIFGDDANTGYKFINATGRTLFVTIYPVPSDWASYSAPSITNSLGTFSLSQDTWDDNGVLTLGGTGQGVYTITVTINDPVNVAWDTTVPPGDPPDTSPKVFTFEIGPMKIVVPDIIKGDEGESVSQFKKEVIYDGSLKTMSFMPINPLQLIITAVNLDTGEDMTDVSTSDQTLTVNAKDAGHYKVTVTVRPEYIFDNTQTELIYELIIHEAEIEAPYLCAEDAAVAVNNVKTVTYGGEKIAGTSQDWVATLTFDNADEARIDWVSLGSNISESGWSDSRLTLSAKPAATYIVTFQPKKNYKWKDGVTVPNYTLVIEKLKIARPELFNDAEVTPEGVHAEYTATSKSIGFDNSDHPIILYFPTLPESSGIDYMKSASVYTLHEGNFETSWDGDKMTKTGSEAGTFKITVTPTNNYCWPDGSSDAVIFTFTIVPINVDCLDMYTTDEFGSGSLMQITDTAYHVYLNYDGQPKTVRIGNPDAVLDKEKYLTTGKYAMTFYLLDRDGNFIEPDSTMTVDETGGFLTVTMVNAGDYRIGVSLNDTNYWWTESKGSIMIYTLTINAEGVNRPRIDESKSVGNNTEGNFGVDIMRGTFSEVTDNHKFFMLVADFDDEKYSEFVKITDQNGVVYDYATIAAMGDSAVVDLRNEALAENHGVFTTWVKKNICLYAFDQGEYTWTLELTSENYKWSGTDDRTITLTIVIKRSPVSGIEMRYVGDEEEAGLNGDDGFLVGDANVRGDEYNSDKIIYSAAVFSEDWKAVRFVQSNIGDIYKAGFSTQFEYEVYKKAANGSYTDEIIEPREDAYTIDELRLAFYDAGEYEIRIRPKDNYCWNNDTTSTSRSYVIFKLRISTLVIEKPEVKDPTGNGVKEVLYNHEFQLFQLELKDYPNGYMVRDYLGFEYINDDLADRIAAGDEPIVHITGTSEADGVTQLAVDDTTSLLSVEARSAGEYHLRIVVSNINNYKFSTGDSSYYYSYRFIIKKISVAIPDAYFATEETLSVDSSSTEYVDSIKYTAAQVAANATDPTFKKEFIDYSSQYKGSAEYCGKYYAVYLYGNDVALGTFSISAVPDLATGDASHQLLPDDPADPSDPDSKIGYYRLGAREVSTYTITLNFVTADYYWGTDFVSGSASRTYEFTVYKKQLDIPEITGYKNTPLISDTLTVEKEFKNQIESITIEDIYFGELLSMSPDVYSFVNIVATGVSVQAFTVVNGKASITIETADSSGTPSAAQVTGTYMLELKINTDNAEWKRETVNLSKYYVIKINKAKLERPVLEGSQTGDEIKKTYDANQTWINALKIENMDPTGLLIDYTLQSTLLVDGGYDGVKTKMLLISTKQPDGTNAGTPVGSYTVLVELIDTDNYEWKTGDIADITFTFTIEPMKVAKPYIYLGGNTEAQMGVVDLTRTVMYEWNPTPAPGKATQYTLDIGNYWNNVADTTSGNVTVPQYSGVVPSIMSYAVTAGNPDNDPLDYIYITDATLSLKFKANGTNKYSDMLMNEYNNGILQLKATTAGRYTVTFTLTDNAVWADGSTDDIEVTLVIKKRTHKDPFIVDGATGATVIDRTATYKYELDTAGAPIERTMQVGNYNAMTGSFAYDYMSYSATLTTGTVSTVSGDGYLVDGGATGTVYTFNATNAGTYVVTFTIDDPINHCWEFADVASVSFTIQIDKLALANPVIESSYLLTTEKVNGTQLEVDFDKHEHTILVKSLFEDVYNPSLAYNVASASGLGSKYFVVTNSTDDRNSDPTYSTNHANRVDNYDATTGTVAGLFDKITPLPTDYYPYNGEKATLSVSLFNLFTLTAYTPGEYYLTFTLTDGDNMMWADGTNVQYDAVSNTYYIDYKLVINKVMHDAPMTAPGTSSSAQYAGGDVNFTIKNAFNGIKEAGSTTVVATVSEEFELTYTNLFTGTTTSYGTNPASFIESWYDGVLVLKMRDVGWYDVKVSITDPDYIKWNGTTDTDTTFTFFVDQRTLDADVTLRSNDPDVGAKLAAGATNWPMSTKVFADILIKGFRVVPPLTVDDNATFDIYYAKTSAPTTRIGTLTGVTAGSWMQIPNNDGTYNVFFTFGNIANGRGNIDKGNYTLNIVQTDTNGNYTLPVFSMPFTIDADPAPFKDNMLVWTYNVSTDPPTVTNGVGPFGGADSPLHLDYKPGVSYTFNLEVNATCLAGYTDDPAPFTGVYSNIVIRALKSWKVAWDGTYGGDRTKGDAGEYEVSVTLTADDPTIWAFDTTTYTFHYVIDPALYDISGLSWDYDGLTPFEFDGTAKTVSLVGTYPTLLTVDHYETTCTEFVSDTFTGSEPMVTGNSAIYAGKYTTTVFFKVPANSNYRLPEDPLINSDKTYIDAGGTFIWTRTWEIKPQKIQVDWTQGGTNTSDGDLVTRSPSTVAGPHASKFAPLIEKEVPVGSGTWVTVSSMDRVPGTTVTYRVTAKLISAPTTPATDYARNYVAEFIANDNPCLMEIGGDDTVIVNHITVNDKRDAEYEYTGDPVVADVVIDIDTSNGIISESDITILFVNRVTNATLPSAPDDIGEYKVVLKLSYTGTDETYALSEYEFNFDIVKAKFHPDDLEWHVRHTTADGTVEARFVPTIGNKWVNVASNEEVEIIYDGYAYEMFLVSENTNLTFTMSDHTQIDANPREADLVTVIMYVTSAQAVFDTAHYEFAQSEFTGTLFEYVVPATVTDPIVITFEWEIQRAFLDLSRINWGYEKPFEFTLVNGIPKSFKVELINLPDYLVDKIDYAVERMGEPIVGDVTNEGNYKTTATIRTSDVSDNYELDTWPTSVNPYVDWIVKPKRLEVPQNDNSWSEFDGTQHNLLKPFGLDVDWEEYFDIVVAYEDFEGNRTDPYDGTIVYGGKYYAYNAGVYSFSFQIKKQFNVTVGSKQMMNIVWAGAGAMSFDTDNDQSTVMTVNKRNLKVTGWFEDYENSYVITSGNIDATRFLEYEFYTGSAGEAGTKVTLDRVLDSAGNETFSMVPVVRKAYQGNITLSFTTGTEFTWFITQEISAEDAIKVDGKPFIYGYSVDGKFTQYTNDELAEGVFVTYMGKNVTFRINNWDYFKNYVEVWNGDDLTQIEAGEYSLTLVLRKDLEKPLYWGKKADGTIDRSSIKLTFEIRYNMLTIPELPAEVTYTGKEIDILSLASNASLNALTKQYGDYVEIVGNKATNVGEQTLYLKIKDEYSIAVRWDNGSEQGLLGTYSFGWKILPVLLQRPEVDPDARIVYDGEAHSVYEILKGYDKTNPSTAIANLMANVNEENARSVNAGGPFRAVLSLPGDNFAWCDASGNKLADRSPWTTEWFIERKTIDFNDAYWGYMDGTTPVAYDPEKPFVYTLVNGAAKNFTVEILGLPDILKLYTSYTTNGTPGNSASAVNSGYTTRVEIDLDRIDTRNYAIVTGSYASISELVWSIVPREFDLPEYDEGWTVFDAKVHDLVAMLGLDEDWAEYFDVKVEYKVNEGDTYALYNGDNLIVVGYSLYKGFYFGNYRLTVTLKNNGSLMKPGVNLKWKDGASNPAPFEITVDKRTVTVIGWDESDEYSEVFFEDYLALPDEIADRFEYIIYEDGNPDVLLKREDVASSSGSIFFIDYRFKQGTDPFGIAYSYGIDLVFEQGVPHPYEFGTRDYGFQPTIWVPMPILEKAVLEYNGELQTFKILGYDPSNPDSVDNVYRLSSAELVSLNFNHGLNLDASIKSYIYLQVANSLSVTAAGEYTAVVRLLSQVKLSWYDPELYTTSADYRTLYNKSDMSQVSLTDIATLYNNKSVTLNFKVKKKVLPMLTDADLEIIKGIIVTYDGTEKDVTQERADLFKILEDKYGKIFEYSGNKGTAAGDYVLGITLKDPDSCIWYEGEPEKVEVSADGYELRYVRDGSGWKIIYVRINNNGPEKDASGNYIEYNDGDYFLDVKYLPEFEMELLDASAYSPTIIDLVTGQLNIKYKYLFDSSDNFVTVNGKNVEYVYVMDGSDIQRFDALGNPDPTGTYVKRFRLDLTLGEKDYGYKVTVKEFVKEYTPLFTRLDLDIFLEPIPATDKDGNPITLYLYPNGTNYELREYQIGTDGKFIPDGGTDYLYTVIETLCEMEDVTKSYNFISGAYVEHPTNDGVYMIRFVLNSNGSKKQQVVYAKDENGNFVIDVEHTKIYENKYNIVVDVQYEVDWKIDSSVLTMPYFNIEKMQQYTGKTLYAADCLEGFLPDLMKIVEGGEGVDAKEYTAKIVLTTENSKWNPEDTTEDYVLVTWRIDTAKVDLSDISWYYTDGTNIYENSDSFVYTRKNGEPVVFWVGIANLPEVLQDRVIFTTNRKEGAYAGKDVGKYSTSVEFDTDKNFEEIEIPDTFAMSVTWSIKRRMLSIPDTGAVQLVFDSEAHDLLKMLGVPTDWSEYYDIQVMYSSGGDYVPYEGHEGNPYIAYGFGSYKFTFTIKSGINSSVTNPNVVWIKSSGEVEVPTILPPDASDDLSYKPAEEPPVKRAVKKIVPTTVEEEAMETVEEVSVVETKTVEKAAVVETVVSETELAIREVCDRLKQLTYGAEINLQSFRKYSMRGTL